jgi:L-ribulokinase
VEHRYVVGVDFGSLSGRAVVVRVEDGHELASAVTPYRHGVMDRALTAVEPAVPLPPDWALQVPQDYRDVLAQAVPKAVSAAGIEPSQVIGMATAFTACTMIPTTAAGVPLSELAGFQDRPHAYVKLWKHHAAQPQADRINELAHERNEPWISRYGGLISSEWEFAKALQILDEDPEIYDATQRWVEAADWIVWQLCGTYVRNACSAGYKGIYQDGAYPSSAYLAGLDQRFATIVEDKIAQPIGQLGQRAGGLTEQAAAWTGLPAGIAVAVGNVDAHVTAPAANAIDPGQLVAIMGTSTCHVVNGTELLDVPGMCGVVDGGIVPNLYGYEAGQSGVGDIFGWFVDTRVPSSYELAAGQQGVDIHQYLSDLAARMAPGESGVVALDWHSGNRSVLVDHELSGLVVGETLATRPEDTYRALVEATAFGTRTIIKNFEEAGLPITEVVVAGGLTRNRFLLQLYADITRRPLSVIASDQGPALGSALHAAVAAGAFRDIRAAAAAMGGSQRGLYQPNPQAAEVYDRLYAEYLLLHDHFGRGGNDVMHRLKALQRQVRAEQRPEVLT